MNAQTARIREMKSNLFLERSVPISLANLADQAILPGLKAPAYKRAEWRLTMHHCIHAVLTADLCGHCVADARQRSKTPPLRIGCWDALFEGGWVEKATGSEKSKKVTRYAATPKLLGLRKSWESKMLDGRSAADLADLVMITDGDGGYRNIPEYIAARAQRDPANGYRPHPQAIANGLEYVRALENQIEKINDNNCNHAWKAFRMKEGVDGKPRRTTFHPSVDLKLIYSGDMFRAGRLYTTGDAGVQNLSPAQRATILIDGEPSVELDFACCQLRMLYHFAHLDPTGDLYRPEQIFRRTQRMATPDQRRLLRDFIKATTNTMLNTGSRDDARGAVFGILDETPSAIRNLLCPPDALLDRIEAAHPELVKRGKFYTNAAFDLMTADGDIMRRVLLAFAKRHKPAVGVHDSVICKASDERLARRIMNKVYGEFFPGYAPVIK